MCPLRLILIFLSATLAGFFVLRNLKSHPQVEVEVEEEMYDDDVDDSTTSSQSDIAAAPPPHKSSSKVFSAIESGFWTCVDMASGRYLWKHLVSSSKGSD